VTTSIVANLGLLGVFKYLGFFADSFSDLLLLLGFDVPRIVLQVALPVGISFYTFQTLSYTIDVYRGHCEPTRRFADFALFVAFFPQLVAGPIERAVNLLPQIFHERKTSRDQFGSGCWLILWGLYKKVVVADNLALMVGVVYAPESTPTNVELLLGTYAFFFQLYCDFSGYTDIARGTARLFGFELMLNFNLPILATSITDFWNRWHISLGTWIRDYVYIPMGGNRRGGLRTSVNLFTMFLLVGLWHGAAWSFVLWGAWNGVMMVVHRLARAPLARVQPTGRAGVLSWLWLRRATIFHLNCFALLLFPRQHHRADRCALVAGVRTARSRARVRVAASDGGDGGAAVARRGVAGVRGRPRGGVAPATSGENRRVCARDLWHRFVGRGR
jgi:alginate O-acetyltransferase complex protein AlgI